MLFPCENSVGQVSLEGRLSFFGRRSVENSPKGAETMVRWVWGKGRSLLGTENGGFSHGIINAEGGGEVEIS